MITHKDLDIWKLGIELVEEVYKITVEFPKEEIYGLTNQMRRASRFNSINYFGRGGARQ